jgi:mannitol operon transcriptional antiterminator
MSQSVVDLSSRTRQILDYLLRVREPVSTRQIASRFGLSSAQVRYSFRPLELWLHIRGFRLMKKTRVGVQIEASTAQREALLVELGELEGRKLALAPDERGQLILLRLLMTRSPLPLDELCERLGVSRTSVFRDLASAREWLEQRGLQLVAVRRRGMLVAGEERLWREAILELLLGNLSPGVLIAACVASDLEAIEQKATRQIFFREACDFFDDLNCRQAERLVTSLERRMGLVFVDEARVNLLLCLSLVLLRVPMGRLIADGEEIGSLPAIPQDTEAVQETVKEIERSIGQALPVDEVCYLAEKIEQAMETGFVVEDQSASVTGETDNSAVELATLLAREAAKYLHAGLLHDQEFINCLALELSMLLSGSPSSIFLTDRSSHDANDAVDPLYGFTCRMLTPVLRSHGHVPTGRLLASVAMHLGTALERLGRTWSRRKVWVICGAGVATARNLISRLNLHLPELGILGVASAFDLARDPRLVSGADAIISTVPLDWVTDVPLLHVSPLLTPQDVKELRVALGLNSRELGPVLEPSLEDGLSMVDILSLEAIDRDVDVNDWEEVVERAGALLLRVSAIWPSYVEAMKDMIRLYGPYVVVAPGAALLHAGPEMGAKRLAMSLVVLRKPIPFGHESHDPVRLALAFSSIDHKTHVRAVGEAMKLLREAGRRKSILEASSNEEILDNIKYMVKEGL